ncbi:MAG: hypothetical protein NC225_03840 [Clostridium sp.]|nr:hypothetical protein [Clostridium sp.]MCM1398598.1 hypothetical protein [Clostridium sp.]MCM1459886.1 hypothetical protein [Bacteroides sp.]
MSNTNLYRMANIYKMALIKLFRYGFVGISVFFGLALSFFMFCYYDTAKKIDKNESDDIKTYQYNNTEAYFVYGKEIQLEDIQYEGFIGCNAVVMDTMFYVGNHELPRTAEVVMHDNELIYPIIAGRYPTQEDFASGESCVVLGKSLKKDTYSRNGCDYIKINGDEYYVTGYVAAENSAIFNHKIILYYENSGTGVLRDLEYYKNNAGVFLVFSSNADMSVYTDLFNQYEEEYSENLFAADFQEFYSSAAVRSESRKIAMLIYVFSVVLVILSIVYWYISNKKEIAIRRAYGYSKGNVILLVLKRILGLLFFAIIASELFMVFLNKMEGSFAIFSMGDFLWQVSMVLRYIVVTIPLVLTPLIIRICMDNPNTLIKECD